LQAQYGTQTVEQTNKAIEVDADPLPLGADVVPVLRYRRYWERTPYDYTKGIVFWSQDDIRIENFPEQHRIRGSLKNSRTKGRYKPTIRVFKNLRNSLADEGKITKENVSSYYIECLLSNIPDPIIREPDLRDRIEEILDQLESDAAEDFPEYTMQHGMKPLFGKHATQWNLEDGHDFVDASRYFYGSD
jgi:hypothetical protein